MKMQCGFYTYILQIHVSCLLKNHLPRTQETLERDCLGHHDKSSLKLCDWKKLFKFDFIDRRSWNSECPRVWQRLEISWRFRKIHRKHVNLMFMGIIKQCTHLHTPLHSFPPTPIHPKYLPTHSHPRKIMPHQHPPTQSNVPLTPNHHYLPKIMSYMHYSPPLIQNNVSLTVNHTKYGPITHIYSNFSLITR